MKLQKCRYYYVLMALMLLSPDFLEVYGFFRWKRRWSRLSCYGFDPSSARPSKSSTNSTIISWPDEKELTRKITDNSLIIIQLDGEELDVVVVKIGGSSLTHKADPETINKDSLEWFSKTISASIDHAFKAPSEQEEADEAGTCAETVNHPNNNMKKKRRAFVIVHGAGSFGHHTAKKYDLKGQFAPPPTSSEHISPAQRRRTMQGLAETRLSVRTLNRLLVSSLIRHGVNAVGVSPCFSIPNMQAHGGGATPDATQQTQCGLATVLRDTLQAGLVPVLHGDACLYGKDGNAGILSGDILVERIGAEPWVSHAIFVTDVEGVFSSDPRSDATATLLRYIQIDRKSLDIIAPILNVSGSSHHHDVTGGLKTKLGSAAVIAASGKNVTIVKCGSESAQDAMLRKRNEFISGTTVYSCQ